MSQSLGGRPIKLPRPSYTNQPVVPDELEQLTATLAERVMGWSSRPDRFVFSNRRWIARWRFQPAERIEDAFRLLEAAEPEQYILSSENNASYVQVRIKGAAGESQDGYTPRAVTLAIARALQIEAPPDAGKRRNSKGKLP